MSHRLILASQSAARAAMLRAASVPFTVMSARVEEEGVKAQLLANNASATDCAVELAGAKALSLSELHPDALILGSDQTLELPSGAMLNKANDTAELKAQLGQLSGTTHRLWSAATLVKREALIWTGVECAQLTMRSLTDEFIESYVERCKGSVMGCVGGYQIETEGVQLFSHIEGSHFCIMGLPLLPLLAALREQGVLAS